MSFSQKYAPTAENKPVSERVIASYKGRLPDSLLSIWENTGWGKYANGLLELVDPAEYKDTLATWLGRHDPNKIPFAISAFGDLFYYRKLTDKDDDVCWLDPHYRKIAVCTWNMEEFLDLYLLEEEVIDRLEKDGLFAKALKKKGELAPGEIYFFAPALILGGDEKIAHVDKGNALVHLELLFQMGL